MLSAFQTVRHLKLKQIHHQLKYRLFPARLIEEWNGQECFVHGRKWTLGQYRAWSAIRAPIERPRSYHGERRFQFLNRAVDIGSPIDWRSPSVPRLWLYNLHYFDYLLQNGMTLDLGLALINDWIGRNPPRNRGTAWEPYPISLRLVNWIKFLCLWGVSPPSVLSSLALQAANLERQIEWHILGNHLFANGKALWIAGGMLGEERWRQKGCAIVLEQVQEQFDADGGHFELSPMYHSILLEDLLDLVNFIRVFEPNDTDTAQVLRAAAGRALGWGQALAGGSGQIPLLNDSVHGVAPDLEKLIGYASRLGMTPEAPDSKAETFGPWRGICLSGYWVLQNGPFEVWFDTAPIGPDYLPGHAHGDMLSILLDFDGQPVFTDSGVFEYREGDARRYARSTPAHNTVAVDSKDQAEFWKAFRVGRRGRPTNLKIAHDAITCSHDGYLRQGLPVTHTRSLRLLPRGIQVFDRLEGRGNHHFVSSFHCAAGGRIEQVSASVFLINNRLQVAFSGADVRLETSAYFPEFGICEERPCFRMSDSFSGATEFTMSCEDKTGSC